MGKTGKSRNYSLNITKYALVLATLWTFLVVALLIWDWRQEMGEAREFIRNDALSHFVKDQAFRFWGAGHGGVYVPPKEHTPPNPYLSHLPNRDIETTTGKKLTLINPAYMLRQLMEEFDEQYGIKGRITSLKPLYPKNTPDEWERSVLKSFEIERTEVSEFTDIDGDPYFRLMRPMIVKKTCLKCHEQQGYVEGDVRGGIGVSVAVGPYYAQAHKEFAENSLLFGLLWLIGLIALVFSTRNIQQRVCERNQAEKVLREKTTLLNNILNSASDVAIATTDLDFRITYYNPMAEKLFGYTAAEVVGKTVFEMHSKNKVEPERFERVIEIIRQDGEYCYSLTQETEAGQRYIESRVASIINHDGEMVGYSLFSRDVTERKQAEEALRASENRFHDVAMCSADWVWEVDTNGIYTFTSGNVRQILGYDPDELIGKTPFELMTEDEVVRIGEHFNQIISKKEPIVDLENWNLSKDGKRVCLLTNGVPRIDKQGDLIGYRGVDKDITERKQAECVLRESEERYRNLFEHASNLIQCVRPDGSFLYVNPAWRKTLGYREDEITNLSMFDIVHPDCKEHCLEIFQRVLAGESINGVESVFISKTGKMITVEGNSNSLYEDGKPVATRGIFQDITETKRLQELESRAQRLESAGRISGQIAHDFNNLLAPLMAYPELIREELPRDHPTLPYLSSIEKSTARIADINQQLLTLGRRGHYNQDVLNLNEIILMAVKEMKYQSDTMICEIDICKDLMNIMGGGAQIHRVISNLLVNAQDAIQDIGTITVKAENYYVDDMCVAFGRVPRGEYVKVTISDTGCGIPEDIIQNIFDPFFTSKTTDKKRGSGLGLSVVDSVIKDHNGYLDLSSKVGHGTSFYLYFPVTRGDTIVGKSEKIIGGSETILIVDDDKIQRDVSSKLLRRLGYNVSSVENGEKAIEFLKDHPQDLLVLDMIMPGSIDGTETYRQILELCPHQKAIILSGFSESDRVLEVQELGAGAFVKKPITKKAIGTAVRKELDRRVKIVTS